MDIQKYFNHYHIKLNEKTLGTLKNSIEIHILCSIIVHDSIGQWLFSKENNI